MSDPITPMTFRRDGDWSAFGKVGVILLVGLTGRQLDEIGRGGAGKLIAEIAADSARQIT